MKVEDGKIISCTEEELYDYWLKRYSEIIGFDEYLRKVQQNGTIVKTKNEYREDLAFIKSSLIITKDKYYDFVRKINNFYNDSLVDHKSDLDKLLAYLDIYKNIQKEATENRSQIMAVLSMISK